MNKRLAPAVLFIVFLLFGGCTDFFLDEPSGNSPETPALGPGEGMLRISLSGAGVQSVSSSARTILPQNPSFTRYELVISDSSITTLMEPIIFHESSIQLRLIAGDYQVVVLGYMGETLVAYSGSELVNIPAGGMTGIETFNLKPLDTADPVVATVVADIATGTAPITAATNASAGDVLAVVAVARAIAAGATDENYHGILTYTLGWDGLSQMPARAELLIEKYSSPPEPIPISWIPPELTVGSGPGTVLLLDKASALVKLNGSIALPAGQYRLTVTVAMDGATGGISRMDIAHIYGGLTSSGLFFYGSGDLISNVGVPSGTNFITAFSFSEYPNATSVVGAAPGADGTRLIMVMVPEGANLAQLSPLVETAPGAVISSPAPSGPVPGTNPPVWSYPEGNYTSPTSWTAMDKNGNTQQYTLVVTTVPSTDCQITDFFFREYPYAAVAINEGGRTINVKVPYNTDLTSLTPVISIRGKSVAFGDSTPINGFPQNFSSSPKTVIVTPYSGSPKTYNLTVDTADDDEAVITSFVIDGYPDAQYTVFTPGGVVGTGKRWPDGTITAELPYGVSLTSLSPLIQFHGKTLDPAPGLPRSFVNPVLYTVTADDNSTRTYKVTLKNKPGNTDTGIFDFRITNVPNSKVVIGRNPRSSDGRIPIVIQVPYWTDEPDMIPAITLGSPTSTIEYLKYDSPSSSSGSLVSFKPPTPPPPDSAISFGAPHEGVYRVTSQTNTSQEYVVLVSMDVQYYYVKATGSDSWPDVYSGGSESQPFKTLAYAVYRASIHGRINKIFVIGELNDGTELGAWENTSASSEEFQSTGGDSGSVFNLIGTKGKTITVTGVSGATLRGTSGKRVLSVTGGADITFENITITGGNAPNGNGGGMFISGNSQVKFSGGSITGNSARSGGGVYVYDDTENGDYDFTLLSGSITGNTATGTAVGNIATDNNTDLFAGGGGIYTSKYAYVWLAGGTVSGNTTAGSGGGILINGYTVITSKARGYEYGLLMSGGTISNNRSNGNVSPHGGGGVYVAKGVFEMMAGEIKSNYSTRQGGGVFVWHDARFTASGTSSITGNDGTGSSKAICSRGYTVMMGRAQADKIYIWNNNGFNNLEDGAFYQVDSFTLAENARAAGIVLAYDDTSTTTRQTRNFIRFIDTDPAGTDQVCLIDLEGHLNSSYQFKDTDLNDWIGNDGTGNKIKILEVDNSANQDDVRRRFPLNTFVGGSTLTLKGKYLKKAASLSPVWLSSTP